MWKSRTKHIISDISKRRVLTTTDNQYQIVYSESLLMPKPWKKLRREERKKYLRPVWQAFVMEPDGDGYTWLVRKYFRTFKAAERAIKKHQKGAA